MKAVCTGTGRQRGKSLLMRCGIAERRFGHFLPFDQVRRSPRAAAELKAQKRRAESAKLRAELDEMNMRVGEEALDRPPPATVRAYREVYGRDPRDWPPA